MHAYAPSKNFAKKIGKAREKIRQGWGKRIEIPQRSRCVNAAGVGARSRRCRTSAGRASRGAAGSRFAPRWLGGDADKLTDDARHGTLPFVADRARQRAADIARTTGSAAGRSSRTVVKTPTKVHLETLTVPERIFLFCVAGAAFPKPK
jgi:hypothetical protein